LYICAGFIIYKSRALPVWLAWASWLLGLLGATFFLSFVALVLTPLWVLYVSILLATRNPTLNPASGPSGA
jgi:hypothetical protein